MREEKKLEGNKNLGGKSSKREREISRMTGKKMKNIMRTKLTFH